MWRTRADTFQNLDDATTVWLLCFNVVAVIWLNDELKTRRVNHQPSPAELTATGRHMRQNSKVQSRSGGDFNLRCHSDPMKK
jgi:hypothetical protein